MWSIHALRTAPQEAIEALKRRGEEDTETQLQNILHLDEKRRTLQTTYDNLQAQSKALAQKIGKALQQKAPSTLTEALRKEAIACKTQTNALSEQLHNIEKEQTQLLLLLPNAPHASVPEGQGEAQNRLIRSHAPPSQPPQNFPLRPHWALTDNNSLDFQAGSTVTGSGFLFFKGHMARLVRGLIQFFLDKATEAAYEEIIPPLLVNEDAALGTGQLPDKEGQMYRLQEAPYYLIPTAEVPITNLWRAHILTEKQLPLRYVSYTPCFRREAGSWGKDVRGLNRLHQFDKVEIVQICDPKHSYEIIEEMISHVESLLKALELPYRLLQLCTGDLGFASAATYDFETYAPAQKKWLEVSSVSNFEAFQARRMQLRYRNTQRKINYPHTLNGSALALPRILACLLEQGQTQHEIRLPAAITPYTGFDTLPLPPNPEKHT